MANRLKMALVHSILALRARGWSYRRIARELGVHRETVARHVKLAAMQEESTALPAGKASGPPESPLGPAEAKPANARSGAEVVATTGVGPSSQCAAFRAVILQMLELGLSARRVYQDLKTEHGFEGSY